MGTKPQALTLVEEQEKAITKPERLFHEINLLHLEGHYFTFDPKGANVFPDPMKSVELRLARPAINQEKPIQGTVDAFRAALGEPNNATFTSLLGLDH